jgi:Flp pilus assembly protein TadB
MNSPRRSLKRSRYMALTCAAAVLVAISAIFLLGAPPWPAVAGVAVGTGWLIWHAPAA